MRRIIRVIRQIRLICVLCSSCLTSRLSWQDGSCGKIIKGYSVSVKIESGIRRVDYFGCLIQYLRQDLFTSAAVGDVPTTIALVIGFGA